MEQFVFVAVVVTPTTIMIKQWLDILTQYERRTPLLHIWPWAIGYYADNHFD